MPANTDLTISTLPAVKPSGGGTTAAHQNEAKKHIRGSSLLLLGRLLAMATNLGLQVLIVRYLSKSDYGSFAYALSIVSLGSSFIVFGMDKAVSRFVPIYEERGESAKAFGTIVLMFGTVISLGISVVLVAYGFQGLVARSLAHEHMSIPLLLILILLSPIQALDSLLTGVFAVFVSPRAIFFRKHLLAPGLQLIVVLLLILRRSDVYFLAGGYVAAGALGVFIYLVTLIRLMRTQSMMGRFSLRNLTIPAGEVFRFTTPLLMSDLAFAFRTSFVILWLGHMHSAADVATFRAVLPIAKLNTVVYENFNFLYTPLAARMYARNEREGINGLYWKTAIWIAVLSFPIFAATFSLSIPLATLLFGDRYRQSGIILAFLALGFYSNAAFGFNGMTLRVIGKIRYMFFSDLAMVLISLCLALLLVPAYGALGAAISTCSALIIQNVLYQLGLIGTGIELFDWKYVRVYATIVLGGISLLLIELNSPSIFISFGCAVLVSVLIIFLNRRLLNVADMFPELRRLPVARLFFPDNEAAL